MGSSRRPRWKICRESAAGAGKVGQPRLNVTSDVTLPEKPFRPGRAFRPSARHRKIRGTGFLGGGGGNASPPAPLSMHETLAVPKLRICFKCQDHCLCASYVEERMHARDEVLRLELLL